MTLMATRKYDKHLKPLRGFSESPEAHRRVERMKDEKLAKAKRKGALKALRAEGFSVDAFIGNIDRIKAKAADRK